MLLGGDAPDRAGALLAAATATYADLGAAWWVDRAAADAHRMGLTRPARRRAPAVTGWDALTHTEHIVVAAIEDGLSNAATAERMGISKRTVEAHLRSVFGKLGVQSRLELALRAAAERRTGA
ncbi:LuxR C-terminal-related transcriptional regulator [Euzebya sp.]|uniref:helix-turn-helix transcriptional regulator n=1 Tax=Euzebya sp. TaxID=1971409 RepID=UPI003516544E